MILKKLWEVNFGKYKTGSCIKCSVFFNNPYSDLLDCSLLYPSTLMSRTDDPLALFLYFLNIQINCITFAYIEFSCVDRLIDNLSVSVQFPLMSCVLQFVMLN